MASIPKRLREVALLIALTAGPTLGPVPGARGEEPVNAFPRGVAEPSLQTGTVTNFKHTIDQVNLENGKNVWESAIEGLPIAVVDKYVLILTPDPKKANVGYVIAVDVPTGRMGWRSYPITLPDWAAVTPSDTHYFGHLVRIKDGALWLKWLAMSRKPGARKAANVASGVARLDLKTHAVEMLDAGKMPAPDLPPGVSEELAKLAARPVETPAGPEKRVATAGKLAAAVDVDKDSVTLRRWDLKTGKALDPVVLARGGRFRATPFPAAGAVLVRPLPTGKEGPPAPVWQVFSLQTGGRLMRLTVERDTLQPTILGTRLYYAFLGPLDIGAPRTVKVPVVRQLRAVDLRTGMKIWTRPLENLPWDPFGGAGGPDGGDM